MGGPGSGRGYRNDGRDTTDGARSIDIREMLRRGWAVPAGIRHGTLGWQSLRTGEQVSNLIYIANLGADAPSLTLVYTSIRYDGDETPRNYAIPLEATPCNYGGVRWWFRCVNCKRRCAIIYSAETWFVCRLCANLAYQSSQDCRKAGESGAGLIGLLQALDRERRQLVRMREGKPGRPTKAEAHRREQAARRW